MNSKNANLSFTISSKKELIELKIIVDFHCFDISKYYNQRTRFLTVLYLFLAFCVKLSCVIYTANLRRIMKDSNTHSSYKNFVKANQLWIYYSASYSKGFISNFFLWVLVSKFISNYLIIQNHIFVNID